MDRIAPFAIEEEVTQARVPTARFQRFINELRQGVNDSLAALKVLQATQSATFTGTPSGTGTFTIPHALGVTPTRYSAQTVGPSFAVVNINSVDATNLVVKLFDAAGAAITSGSWTVAWSVAK